MSKKWRKTGILFLTIVMVFVTVISVSAASGTWKQNSKGWWYSYSQGGYPANQWESIGGKWYHFDSKGYMQTGWLKDGSKWYYLGTNGAMTTGWQKVSGKWYYMNSSGVMQTGWIKVGGKWYYMNSSGAMQTGWLKVGGKWYYMNSSGAMQTGWLKVGGKWYYMNSSGVMQTGWLKLSGKWYYLNSSGAMVTGTQVIGGKAYVFDSNGVLQQSASSLNSNVKAAYAQVIRNYRSKYSSFSWFFDYSDLPSSANNKIEAFMHLVDFDHNKVPELVVAYGIPNDPYGYLDIWEYKNGQASRCASLSKYLFDMADNMHIHISYYNSKTCLLVGVAGSNVSVFGFDKNGTFKELYQKTGPEMNTGYPYNYSVNFGEGYAYKNEIIPVFLWGPSSKNEVLNTINKTKTELGLQ